MHQYTLMLLAFLSNFKILIVSEKIKQNMSLMQIPKISLQQNLHKQL